MTATIFYPPQSQNPELAVNKEGSLDEQKSQKIISLRVTFRMDKSSD
jgi:hypothetical protein